MSVTRRNFLAFISGTLSAPLFGGCAVHSGGEIKPSNSATAMEKFLSGRGLAASQLSVPQIVESAMAFYRDVRFSGLANDQEADMLLFQWGVFNWGHGENFEFDITRQFISAGDNVISQLRCTAYFPPTPELRAIPVANRWCASVTESEPFKKFIYGSAPYHAVSSVPPLQVQLRWGKV